MLADLAPAPLERWVVRGPDRAIPDCSIGAWIRQTASEHGDAIALRQGDHAVSYRELIERSADLSARLGRAGIGAGAVVGLCAARSIDWAAGVLAILQRGAILVPLDPATRAEWLSAIVDNIEPAAIVTQTALAPHLPGWGLPVVLIDAAAKRPSAQPLSPPVPAESPAFLIAEAAPGGRASPVSISHREIVNLVQALCDKPGLSPGDTVLAVAPSGTATALIDLSLALASGSTLVLAEREEDGATTLSRLIDESKCTLMQAPPAVWQSLLAIGWKAPAGLRGLCVGEPLSPALARRLLAAGLDAWATQGGAVPTFIAARRRVTMAPHASAGRPIDNIAMAVLGTNGLPKPRGEPGDLWIGGAGTSAGAIVFPGIGLMTPTGEIARLQDDATIEWLGRRDREIDAAGTRINLAEIEAAIADYPTITAAAVRNTAARVQPPHLIGYIMTQAPAPSAGALRDFLSHRLPAAALPRRFVELDHLPLTPAGAIDDTALLDAAARGDGDRPRHRPTHERWWSTDGPEFVRLGAGPGRPLFWIAGTPSLHRALATAFSGSRALIGLPIEPALRHALSLAEIARDLTAAMCRHGRAPFLLGGAGAGAVVAFETAARLRSIGEEVELVIIANVPCADRPHGAVQMIENASADRDADDTPRRGVDLDRCLVELIRRYRPQPIDVAGLIATMRGGVGEVANWDRLFGGGLSRTILPGASAAMLDPVQSRHLADAIARRLRRNVIRIPAD